MGNQSLHVNWWHYDIRIFECSVILNKKSFQEHGTWWWITLRTLLLPERWVVIGIIQSVCICKCQSWWLCGIKHKSYSPTWTLGLWFRIPLQAWMSVFRQWPWDRLIPVQWMLPRVYRLRNWRSGGRVVWSINCIHLHEHWDCGFESHCRHGCLCLGSGLATDWFLSNEYYWVCID
jgi:hypothetical protein